MKKNKILIYLFAFITLFLIGFTVTTLIYKFLDKGYNYNGRNGEYRIDVIKIENITIYKVHVKKDNVEYIYNFRNKPEDLKDIELEDNLLDKINRPKGVRTIYVTRDLELANKTENYVVIAAASFESILGTADYSMYQIPIQNTYTIRVNNTKTPRITCKNVSPVDAIIYMKLGTENRVYSDENGCIILEGKDTSGLIKASEKFAYYLMGVY